MKYLLRSFLILLTSAALIASAHAEGYFGAKAIKSDVDSSAYDSALDIGIFLGADFATLGSNTISLEGELTTTIIDGSVGSSDWSLQTFALYAAMRTGKDTYLKIRGGYMDREITVSPGGSNSDTGFAYGIGFGFPAAGSTMEIEYTVYNGGSSADITMLSLGYLF